MREINLLELFTAMNMEAPATDISWRKTQEVSAEQWAVLGGKDYMNAAKCAFYNDDVHAAFWLFSSMFPQGYVRKIASYECTCPVYWECHLANSNISLPDMEYIPTQRARGQSLRGLARAILDATVKLMIKTARFQDNPLVIGGEQESLEESKALKRELKKIQRGQLDT